MAHVHALTRRQAAKVAALTADAASVVDREGRAALADAQTEILRLRRDLSALEARLGALESDR